MADILSSVVGGALGRLAGSALDSAPSQGGLANASARDDVAPVAMPETPETARQDLYKEMNSLRRVQNDLLRSLEARSTPNASDTLFAISRGLLAPNPTGQFGAAFGNAVGEMQGQRAQQDAAAQQLAKMRLEMGQSNIGMAEKGIEFAKEAQALKMISDIFGTTPAATAQALSGGSVPGGDISKITPELYMKVQQVSPKLAEGLKNAYNMDIERAKLVREDFKAGVTVADLMAKYGPAVAKYLPAGGPVTGQAPAAPAGAAAPAQPEFGADGINRYVVDTDQQAEALAKQLQGTDQKFTVSVRPGQGAATPAVTRPITGEASSEEQNLPLATQAELRAGRIKQSEEEVKPLREAVMASNPAVTSARERSLRELMTLLKQNEDNVKAGGADIFGLLQKQGVISAIYNAAQEGVRIPGGSFSLPADKFVQALKVPENLRPMLTRATQILGEQFLLNARANKGVLGTQVSNFDAQLMGAPMASVADSSKAIEYWTRLNILGNKEREQTYQAYSSLPAERRTQFFNSPEYQRIVRQYNDYYGQFVNKYAPFTPSSAAQERPPSNDISGTIGRAISNIISP
jgi:hypothetical protein